MFLSKIKAIDINKTLKSHKNILTPCSHIIYIQKQIHIIFILDPPRANL